MSFYKLKSSFAIESHRNFSELGAHKIQVPYISPAKQVKPPRFIFDSKLPWILHQKVTESEKIILNILKSFSNRNCGIRLQLSFNAHKALPRSILERSPLPCKHQCFLPQNACLSAVHSSKTMLRSP